MLSMSISTAITNRAMVIGEIMTNIELSLMNFGLMPIPLLPVIAKVDECQQCAEIRSLGGRFKFCSVCLYERRLKQMKAHNDTRRKTHGVKLSAYQAAYRAKKRLANVEVRRGPATEGETK